MKTIIKLIIIMTTSLVFSQSPILDFANLTVYTENCYYKDVNNRLNKFEGTWRGMVDNDTIYFYFSKQMIHYDFGYKKYYIDELCGTYKIIDGITNEINADFTNYSGKECPITGGLLTCTDFRCADIVYWELQNRHSFAHVFLEIHEDNYNKMTFELWGREDRMREDYQYFPFSLSDQVIIELDKIE